MGYRIAVPGHPVVITGRYYLVRKNVAVVDQPPAGFRSVDEAEQWVGNLSKQRNKLPAPDVDCVAWFELDE